MISSALQIYVSTNKIYDHGGVMGTIRSVSFEVLCNIDTDVDALELEYYFMYNDGCETRHNVFYSICDFEPCEDGTMLGSIGARLPSGTEYVVAYLLKDGVPVDSAVKYVKGDYPNGEY